MIKLKSCITEKRVSITTPSLLLNKPSETSNIVLVCSPPYESGCLILQFSFSLTLTLLKGEPVSKSCVGDWREKVRINEGHCHAVS